MKFNIIDNIFSGIRIFRDDLYPFLGGGNKGRKMDEIAQDIFLKRANAIVTTGGIQSNHCRAVAIFAASKGMDCTLVLHGNEKKFLAESGNAKIMRHSGATIQFVNHPQEIGMFMDQAMDQYMIKGKNPYYIYGGGHTLQGGKAYIDAVAELQIYCERNQWYPDYIFHASGTGSTQSGLLAGLDKFNFNSTKIIGISVARRSALAQDIVREFYQELCELYKIKYTNRSVVVLDDYLCGGYEKFNGELKKLSDDSLKNFGFTLDTCYTGKAFYGMQEYIKKNNLTGNILFWHTGGIFNFLAE